MSGESTVSRSASSTTPSTSNGPTEEEASQPKRWVDAEIATLDPETDYERIVHLIAEYKLNDFVMNLNYSVGFMSNTMPAPGSDVIIATGKAETKPQTRYLDTVKFFWQWLLQGPSDPEVQASIKRLNRLHAHLYDEHPDSFRDNDDWIFTLANLATTADRMRARVGAPLQPKNVRTAWHHFWRDIGSQMEGLSGPLHSFPEDYDALMEFVEEFEHRSYPYTPTGRMMCEAMIRQFSERFFPEPLRPIGRTIVMAFVPPAVARRHGLPPANRLGVWLVHKVFRFIFFAQDHFLPDARIPTSDALRSPKYQAWRKDVVRQERALPTA